MKKFSDMIQKSGNQEKPKARESPVKKRMFKITKRDDEQMLAFGWANVSIRSDGELIEDWQEDIVEPEDLEQAAYEFVQLYREGGEMHERGGVATLVESVVFSEPWVFRKERFLSAGGLASKCLMQMYGKRSKMAHILCSVLKEKQKG